MNDKELLKKIGHRDEKAFELAVNKYKSLVFKIAIGFVHDKEIADDLVQDVFVKLWENAPKLELKNTKLSTWLYRVTTNHCINYTRRQKFNSFVEDISFLTRTNDDGSVEIQIEDSSGEKPDKELENKELGLILKKAINSLPKKQKIAFVLREYQNLSSKEIAEIMEITPGNVDTLIYRAKKHLQNKILKLIK